MKPVILLPAILLTASLAAQQPTPAQYTPPNQGANQSFGVAGMEGLGPGSKPAIDLEHAPSRCAIGMFARQGGGLHVLRAGKDGQPAQPAMEPSLTLHSPNGKQIVSAGITARGLGANKGSTLVDMKNQDQGVILRGDNSSPQRPRLTHALTVKFQPDGDNDFSGDFRLPGFVVLESIALNSITYADGSIQNFDSSICSTKPSPLMLVGTSRH